MILKKTLILAFILTTTITISQNNVCESSSEIDIMMELNNIEKCYSNTQPNTATIPTRSRYIRTKKNLHISALKKSLEANTIDNETTVVNEYTKENYVKLKNLTQAPVLLTLKGASDYREDLKKALQFYIDKNLIYPSDAKSKGIEGIVWASFVIDSKGYVREITTSGPINGKVFEIEAERLIRNLPNFIPGKLHGTYVNVKYLMTINFELNK